MLRTPNKPVHYSPLPVAASAKRQRTDVRSAAQKSDDNYKRRLAYQVSKGLTMQQALRVLATPQFFDLQKTNRDKGLKTSTFRAYRSYYGPGTVDPHCVGDMTKRCQWCRALFFPGETVGGICCKHGKVQIPPLEPMPSFLMALCVGLDKIDVTALTAYQRSIWLDDHVSNEQLSSYTIAVKTSAKKN